MIHLSVILPAPLRPLKYEVCPHVLVNGDAVAARREPSASESGLILCLACVRLAASGSSLDAGLVEGWLAPEPADSVTYHLGEPS